MPRKSSNGPVQRMNSKGPTAKETIVTNIDPSGGAKKPAKKQPNKPQPNQYEQDEENVRDDAP